MSLKNLDKKNRWRNKTVAFRMSPEEAEQLDTRVSLSGLTKQDYLIQRVLEKEIIVTGNPRVFKALRDQLKNILNELRRIESVSGDNPELFCLIWYVAGILDEMKERR